MAALDAATGSGHGERRLPPAPARTAPAGEARPAPGAKRTAGKRAPAARGFGAALEAHEGAARAWAELEPALERASGQNLRQWRSGGGARAKC